MKWNEIKTEEDLNTAVLESNAHPILIFKYSTRCAISDRVLSIFQHEWDSNKENNEKVTPYLLDLIQYRNLSNEIARRFKVRHESPQVLVIKEGECIYNESHGMVRFDDVIKSVS